MALEPPHGSQIGPGLHVPPPDRFTRVEYDADEDTLYVRPADDVAAMSEPLDDGVWARIDPKRRVVGFDVEGYEETFLPEHPELAALLCDATNMGASELPIIAGWLAWRVASAAVDAARAGQSESGWRRRRG